MFTIDLEEEWIQSLIELLKQDLDSFAKGSRRKGDRLLAHARVEGELVGDELKAWVDDGRQRYQIKMQFPLFDLGQGFHFASCSCVKTAMPLDEQRCEHLYLITHKLKEALTRSLGVSESGWQQSLKGLQDAPLALKSQLIWRFFEPEAAIRPYLQVYDDKAKRFHPGRLVTWQEFLQGGVYWQNPRDQICATRLTPTPDGGIDESSHIDFFGLFSDLRGHPHIYQDGVQKDLQSGTTQINFIKQGEHYRVRFECGEQSGEPLLLGERGFLMVGDRCLYLCEVPPPLQAFFLRSKEESFAIPLSERLELLTYLSHFPREVGVVSQDLVQLEKKGNPLPLLQLTPNLPASLTLRLRVRPFPGSRTYPPGEGSEVLLNLQDPEAAERILRDFAREVDMAGDLKSKLQLLFDVKGEARLYGDQAYALLEALEACVRKGECELEWAKGCPPIKVKSLSDGGDQPKLTLGGGSDFLGRRVKVLIDGEEEDLARLMALLSEHKSYIPLKPHRHIKLSDRFRDHLNRLRETFASSPSMPITPTNLIPHLEKDTACFLTGPLADFLNRYLAATTAPPPNLQELQATPRDYQREGIHFLYRTFQWSQGACLADDMGLGKTLQALALAQLTRSFGPSLVICPTSVMDNWHAEAKKFCPKLRPLSLKSWRESNQPLAPGDLVITSYARVRLEPDFHDQAFNLIILDEAQTIKNPKSQTWQAIKNLQRRFCLALSGTPVENHLGELWSIFDQIAPHYLGDLKSFKTHFIDPIQSQKDPEALKKLRQLIRPLFLRRSKTHCLKELPEKTESVLWIPLSKEEATLYEALRQKALKDLEEKEDSMKILAALNQLRQCVNHPKLVYDDFQGISSKLKQALQLMADLYATGHKALIFSQFVKHLDFVDHACLRHPYRIARLDGSTPAKKRGELVQAFQEGGFDFFLISLKAGGTGLTLTEADYVLHLDPWWNPAVEDQASDRIYRMGQRKPVNIIKLLTKNTIEEKIHHLHRKKRALAAQIGEGGGMVDVNDLKALLGPNQEFRAEPM